MTWQHFFARRRLAAQVILVSATFNEVQIAVFVAAIAYLEVRVEDPHVTDAPLLPVHFVFWVELEYLEVL